MSWAPARNQAPSTNRVTVLVSDDGVPAGAATNTFVIVVGDFVEMLLGSAVVRSGESGSIPVSVISTAPVTNLGSLLWVPSQQVSGLGITTVAPGVLPATLEPQGPNAGHLTFRAATGQILPSGQPLGELSFSAVSAQSAFVPVTLSNLTAWQLNGVPVPRTLAGTGRVVVVGNEPLVEAFPSTNGQTVLVLYGEPGPDYVVESAFALGESPVWTQAWQGPLTTLFQTITLPGRRDPFVVYRAFRR